MRSLVMLLKWTQEHFPGSKLYHLVRDAHRFAQHFVNTITEHPLLIYASAVPLTPHNTLVYKTSHHYKMPHVLSSIEPTWSPLLQMLIGHKDAVLSFSFSPDGSKIVSGSHDKTVRVWDAVTGQAALPPLEGHESRVDSVCFSPDGSEIVSGSADKTVRVWDAITGHAALPPLEGHEDEVYSVSFSPDGSKIVSGSYEQTVLMWDAVTGQQLNEETPNAPSPRLTNPDKAQMLLSLNEEGYFTDDNSGRCLGKIPVGFAFINPQCHQSRCIVWRKTASWRYIPVIISFPQV